MPRIRKWSLNELKQGCSQALKILRDERASEPTENHTKHYIESREAFEDLLELTADLTAAGLHSSEILLSARFLEAFRYIAGPPASDDDLAVLAGIPSLAAKNLRDDPDARASVVSAVFDAHDRERFPWLTDCLREGRLPDEDGFEEVRRRSIEASAALLASGKTLTWRRAQHRIKEDKIAIGLQKLNYKHVKGPRTINTRDQLPQPGEFYRLVTVKGAGSTDDDSQGEFKGAQADFVIHLLDGKCLVIDSKASSTTVNSTKRLNDAIARCDGWRNVLGSGTTTGIALAGNYSPQELDVVQGQKIAVWWMHDLKPLFDFVCESGGRGPRS